MVFYRIVKLTSPNLNYVVLFGAFTLYGSIYFYVLPSERELTSTLYCHVRNKKYSSSRNLYCLVFSFISMFKPRLSETSPMTLTQNADLIDP